MSKLRLVTNGELEQIFGPLDDLLPIHEGRKLNSFVYQELSNLLHCEGFLKCVNLGHAQNKL